MMRLIFFPLSTIYAFVASFRNFLYDYNFLKSYYFHQIPVISIGNIAVGGTGKTPLTEYILKTFEQKNLAVLSRGYKRKTKGFVVVSPDKSPFEVGDEPLQMCKKFPAKTFAVCEKRVDGINKLISNNNIDAIILDDAFQHRKVKPKLSILLTEYDRPFFKDHFLPSGRLRDNKHEVHRADIIVVTKSPNKIKPIEKTIWRDNLKLRPYQNLFFASIHYGNVINIFDTTIKQNQENFKDNHIFLFSGIANHSYFLEHVKHKISKEITESVYKDHKIYTETDILEIINKFENISNTNKIILTTEKDSVKIRTLNIDKKYHKYFFYQEIETKFLFEKEDEFNGLISKALN